MSAALLALEPLIVARLKEKLPADIQVLTAPDLAGPEGKGRHVPAVYVVYGGYRVPSDQQSFTTIVESWLTWCAVRNVHQIRQGADARSLASEMQDGVRLALSRWRPAGYKPLSLASAPRPYWAAGTAYFPLAWDAPFTLNHGDIC